MLGLDARFAAKLDKLVAILQGPQYRLRVVISDGTRSREAQRLAYERYKRGAGPMAAPPGRSCHEYGAAADLVVSPRSDSTVRSVATALGLRVIEYGTTSNHVHVEDAALCRELRGDLPATRSLPDPQETAARPRQIPPGDPAGKKGCP